MQSTFDLTMGYIYVLIYLDMYVFHDFELLFVTLVLLP